MGNGRTVAEINDKLELGFEEDNIPSANQGKSEIVPTQTREEPQKRSLDEVRVIDLEDEQAKTEYWRAIDNKQQGHWGAVKNKVQQRFDEEQEAIIQAVKRNADLDILFHRQQREWRTLLMSTWKAMIETFGEDMTKKLNQRSVRQSGFVGWDNSTEQFVNQQVGEKITKITETTKEEVKEQVKEGTKNNEPIDSIMGRVGKTYEDFKGARAGMIARTEVHSAATYGIHEAGRQSNVVKKKSWISSRDMRVRDTHKPGTGVDGQTVPKGKPFTRGLNGRLMYPGDPSGPPEEIINCRCTIQFHSADRK